MKKHRLSCVDCIYDYLLHKQKTQRYIYLKLSFTRLRAVSDQRKHLSGSSDVSSIALHPLSNHFHSHYQFYYFIFFNLLFIFHVRMSLYPSFTSPQIRPFLLHAFLNNFLQLTLLLLYLRPSSFLISLLAFSPSNPSFYINIRFILMFYFNSPFLSIFPFNSTYYVTLYSPAHS